jgi:phenylpropionate dioxygenase-like ring-hydroxylating dioxygenase large terminal subunit
LGEASFAAEMDDLARGTWQFFCSTDELSASGDWVAKTVLTRPVFVQHFEGRLRAFLNICSHRGFPLRCAGRGNSIVQCGFHGWVYDALGVPTGIPRNAELFALDERDRRALALPSVRVETIGRFVFVALSDEAPELRTYLGPLASVFEACSARVNRLFYHHDFETHSNWKLAWEITLEDYHLQMVHSNNFGSGEPRPLYRYVYQRHDLHSSLLTRRDPDWKFDSYWSDLQRGVVDHTGYKIHQAFPNLLAALEPNSLNVCIYTPLDSERTAVELRFFDWADNILSDERVQSLVAVGEAVQLQDQHAIETLASAASSWGQRRDVLGRLEERIGWFRESYSRFRGSTDQRRNR